MAENDELTDQDQDDLVVNMVRYMLNQSISKIPIKKADLVTVCLRGKGKTFGPVYEKAAQVLKKVIKVLSNVFKQVNMVNTLPPTELWHVHL